MQIHLISYSFDIGKADVELVCDKLRNITYVVISCFVHLFAVNAEYHTDHMHLNNAAQK